MSYKPSDTMNLVHEVKKLGWHFTHSKENISINRHNVTLSLYREVDPEAWREEYRKKQAAGVRFENRCGYFWQEGNWNFEGNKEDYREVQEYPVTPKVAATGIEPTPPTPHAAERALWKAQREAGTNEVWQVLSGNGVADIRVDVEPNWHPDFIYRVKPMKLTARIIRREFYPRMAQPACLVQNWEFAGTREEYRAECEKYGYVVLSEIKEVVEKPKTVKYYMAMVKYPNGGCLTSWVEYNKEKIITDAKCYACTIIGDIEEREVET